MEGFFQIKFYPRMKLTCKQKFFSSHDEFHPGIRFRLGYM